MSSDIPHMRIFIPIIAISSLVFGASSTVDIPDTLDEAFDRDISGDELDLHADEMDESDAPELDVPVDIDHQLLVPLAAGLVRNIQAMIVVGGRSLSELTAWASSNQFEVFLALIESFLSLRYIRDYSFFAARSPGLIPAVVSLSILWARSLTYPRDPPMTVRFAIAHGISVVLDILSASITAHTLELWMIMFQEIGGTNESSPIASWLALGMSRSRFLAELLVVMFGSEIIGAPVGQNALPAVIPRAFNNMLVKTFRNTV